MNISP
jgi:hypothetical protein